MINMVKNDKCKVLEKEVLEDEASAKMYEEIMEALAEATMDTEGAQVNLEDSWLPEQEDLNEENYMTEEDIVYYDAMTEIYGEIMAEFWEEEEQRVLQMTNEELYEMYMDGMLAGFDDFDYSQIDDADLEYEDTDSTTKTTETEEE